MHPHPPLRRAVAALATTALVTAALVGTATVSASAAPAACGHVAGDFDGDGHPDLAAPVERQHGGLRIVYGTATGLSTARNQLLTSTTPGMPDAGYWLGGPLGAVTTGNFNGDCYADLAVQAFDPDTALSAVFVFYGSAAGITTGHVTVFTVADINPGLDPDTPIGGALTAGDFDGDGYSDLAVYADANSGDAYSAGGVGVLYGSASGLSTDRRQWIDQETPGVPGTSESGDSFGSALVAADFTGDGRSDLAIGVPQESIGDVDTAGDVVVVPGSATGLTGTGATAWSQNTTGVPGTSEHPDQFGWALAAGDVNHDGHADLAVAAIGESIGTVEAGDVTLLLGSATGVTATGSTAWDEDTSGVPGSTHDGDEFGFALAFGDFNGDGYADLAVGVPGSEVNSMAYAGAVTVLPGTRNGLTATGSISLSQSTTGVPGASEFDDTFGSALVTLPVGTYAALVAGVPGEDAGTTQDNGSVYQFPGSTAGLTTTGCSVIGDGSLTGGAIDYDSLGNALA
jgi:hypothetical protein